MARRPNPFLIDDDNPELTDEQLAALRPASEAMPAGIFAALVAEKRNAPAVDKSDPIKTPRDPVRVSQGLAKNGLKRA